MSKSLAANQSRLLFETNKTQRDPGADAGAVHATVEEVAVPSPSLLGLAATGPIEPNLHQKGKAPDPPAAKPRKATETTDPPCAPIAPDESLSTNGKVAAALVGANVGTAAVLADTRSLPATTRTVTKSVPTFSGVSTKTIAEETTYAMSVTTDPPLPSTAVNFV